jgi:hypothetical protein
LRDPRTAPSPQQQARGRFIRAIHKASYSGL